MTQANEVEALIAEARGRLNAARRALETEQPVDLAELQGRVAALCERLSSLPLETARGHKGVLLALYDDLDRLSADLTRAHGELGQQLKGLSGGSQAAAAYGPPRPKR